jgi:hypothetical protein
VGYWARTGVALTAHASNQYVGHLAARQPTEDQRGTACFRNIPKLNIAKSMTATGLFHWMLCLRPRWWLVPALFALFVSVDSTAILAQEVESATLVTLNGEAEERLRLSQIVGKSNAAGFLIRSASSLSTLGGTRDSSRGGYLTPEFRLIHNSGLPFSLNEGPLWASRGWNGSLLAGGFVQVGRVRLIAAPTLVSEQNLDFQVIPYRQDAAVPRSVWANPFHPPPESIDLPLRFGDKQRVRIDPGQSSLTVDAGDVSVGLATENLWWGPGIRNAIVLSNNATGFPHAFVQTRGPLSTPIGPVDAQLIFGALRESEFFDGDSTNNTRTLSGLAATWSPWNHGLTVGAARIVMGAQRNDNIPPAAVFDVFRSVGHANTDTLRVLTSSERDQIFSLFGRWVFPSAGFEAFAEWARFEEPLSVRDFLEFPAHSQGYTLGFQWARPDTNTKRTFRLQGESTYLEPDASLRVRPVASSYTSRGVPQGFTNQGQTLGAAIGPGASSQWLAGDMFAPDWRLGAYLGRIRWDNGTLFEPIVPQFRRQDVTLLAGVRGSYTWRGTNLLVDFSHAARFYYLFQAYVFASGNNGGIDLINNTVSITVSRAVWPR